MKLILSYAATKKHLPAFFALAKLITFSGIFKLISVLLLLVKTRVFSEANLVMSKQLMGSSRKKSISAVNGLKQNLAKLLIRTGIYTIFDKYYHRWKSWFFSERVFRAAKYASIALALLLVVIFTQSQLYRVNPFSEKQATAQIQSVQANEAADIKFQFSYQQQEKTGLREKLFKPLFLNREPRPTVKLYSYKGKEYHPEISIKKESETVYSVTVAPSQIPPGEYTAELKVYKDGKYYEQQQRFAYGVLAVNTRKATYLQGEVVELQMAALRNDGHTVCDADLSLQITSPAGTKQNLDVVRSGKCDRNNVTDVPDYSAVYHTEAVGEYEIMLTNNSNGYQIRDKFAVVEEVPFEIERIGPTRIYPFVPYKFSIQVKANKSYQGKITETVPASFLVNRETEEIDGQKVLTFDVDLKAGETEQLVYEFDAPDESPELYLIGPLRIGRSSESRQWQIAGDADETEIFATPGTHDFTVPGGVTSLTIESWGGGGGGKGGSSGLTGGGGGGGAYSKKVVNVTPGQTYDVVVGAGGSGGSANNGNGSNGGNSFFSADTGGTTAAGGTSAMTSTGGSAGTSNGSADLSYAGGNGGNGNASQISFVGASSDTGTSVSIPAHKKGDLLVLMAYRTGSNNWPTILTPGWTVLGASGANSNASLLAFKVAGSDSETSGTWTNASEIAVQVFRGHGGIGIFGEAGGNNSTMSYPALSLTKTDGTSWVGAFGAHRAATNVGDAPTGMVNTTYTGTRIAGHNTNGAVSSWSNQNVSVNSSGGWRTWVFEILAPTSSTSLSYVSSAIVESNSIPSMPSHTVGDLLLMYVYRDGSTGAPTMPAGWFSWGAGAGANSNASIGGYTIAASSSESSGTWTNTTGLALHVYRNTGGYGGIGNTGALGTTVSYPEVTMDVTDGTSWIAGFAGHRNLDTALENPPSGMINRVNIGSPVNNELAGHDTDGPVTFWNSTDVSVGGTSSGWRARTVEIKSAVQAFGAGGGGSSAGTASAGTNGNNNSNGTGGGTATAPTDGGNGGAGGNARLSGTNGSAPGGGGGGGGNSSATGNQGGSGGNGKVIITYEEQLIITISGTCKQEDQSTNCSDSGTIKVAINGDLQEQEQTVVSGNWSITNIPRPEQDDVLTVFIDGAGEGDEAVAVTTYDGDGDVTGIELIEQRLSIGNAGNRTVTNTDLAQYDNNASTDEDIFFEVDGGNDLTMVETGKASAELYIKIGNTYRPASDNTGNVTVNDLEIAGTLTADGNTITVTGDNTPFVVSGTLNEDTSTFKYTSTSATSITPETYYHLTLAPSATGGPTYTLENAAFNILRNFTVGDDSNPVSVNWNTNDPALSIGGNFVLNNNATWVKSDSAIITMDGATSPVSLEDRNSSLQDLGRITIDGPKEVDLESSIKVQTMNVTTGDTLDMQNSEYTLTITGSGTLSTRPFIVVGTLSKGDGTVEYTGTSSTTIDDDDYYNLILNQEDTDFDANGSFSVANVFAITAGTFDAGNRTITLNGSGDPFEVDGTFVESTSTVNYNGTAAANASPVSYYNLNISSIPQSSSFDISSLTGSIDVLGDLTVGANSGSGTVTFNLNTNDTELNVADDVTINSKGAISASSNSGAPLTVGGDFINNGAFTHNNGKVIMNGLEDTTQNLSGSSAFYELFIETGDRIVNFSAGATTSIIENGAFTLTGSSCDNMTRVRSSLSGSSSNLDIDSSASASVSHVDLQDINLTGKSITAVNSVDSGNNSSNWTVSANACLGTSHQQTTTGYAFQRKVLYGDENENYWSFYHDGDEIEIQYSSDNGSTWSNPTTSAQARLPYDTNDFSVWYKSISGTEYVLLAVADGGTIKVRQGILSEDDVSWDTDVSTALVGEGDYMYPYITLDSSNYIWVAATQQSGSKYMFHTSSTGQTLDTDPSTWMWNSEPHKLGENIMDANVYGTISALSDQDMYGTFVNGTDVLGCKWKNSESTWRNSDDEICEAVLPGSGGESSYFDSLTEGLVGYWKMNDNTGTSVVDSSGNGHTGNLVSSPAWTTGAFAYGIGFDGTSNRRFYATDTMPTGDFSYSFWAYFTATGIRDETVMSAENSTSGGDNDEFLIGFTGGATLRFALNGAIVAEWGEPSSNVWHHFVVTRSGSSVTLYSNGQVVGTGTDGAILTFPTGCNLYIGIDPRTGCDESGNTYGSGLRGRLDDVRVYNRAISTEEIFKIYSYKPDSVKIDDASNFGSPGQTGGQVIRNKSGTLYSVQNGLTNIEVWKSLNGVTWTEQNLASKPACASAGCTALAAEIQSDGVINILYKDFNDMTNASNLKFTTFNTGTDTFGSVTTFRTTSSGTPIGSISIAVDASDKEHIIWNEGTDLYYCNNISVDFGISSSLVNIESVTATVVDIEIDSDGKPQIAYINSADDALTVRRGNANNTTEFSTDVLDVDTDINDIYLQAGVSIAIDTLTGDTWIAYIDDTGSDDDGANDSIALAKHNYGDAWATWAINTSNTNVALQPSISSPGDNNIYVFYENDEDDISYDVFGGTGWSGEVVVHNGTAFRNVKVKGSFEWNNYGTNVIDYLYSDGMDVFYDYFRLRKVPINIDNASDFGALPSAGRQLMRIANGNLYAVINDGGNCEVWMSNNNGNTWSIQDSADDPACNTTENMAAAIDGAGIIHMIYEDDASAIVRYITFNTGTSQFGSEQTVTSLDTSNDMDIAIDSNNIPHVVAQTTITNPGVEYTNRVGGSWNGTPVVLEQASGLTINSVSITVNEEDIPEIAYINSTDSDLTAAVGNQNNSTSFTLQDIDTDVNNSPGVRGSSLAIDSSGNTWIAYVDSDNDIALASHADAASWSTWVTETTKTDDGMEPAISVNAGDIYVFYQDDQDDIVYDVYDGFAWSGENVLEMQGVLQDVKPKWSFLHNYDSEGVHNGNIEVDYLYSDGTDVWYNRILFDEPEVLGTADTVISGIATGTEKNISTVQQNIEDLDYIHLAYVNSSGKIMYDLFDGDWDFSDVELDGNSDNTYIGLSIDSNTNDLYLGSIRSSNNDVYTTKATYGAGPEWDWESPDSLVTDAGEIYTNYSANYSGPGQIGAILSVGDTLPFMLDWETVLAGGANSAPTVSTIVLNDSGNINLTENSTVNVSWTASVADADGYEGIASVTGKLYRSGVSGAETCLNDNSDCYEDLSCDLTGCTGNSCTATCTVAMYFHADPTDASSPQPEEYWRGWMEATDSASATGEGFSTAGSPDVNSLLAISVDPQIDYGVVITGDSSAEQTLTVTNTGNIIVDTELSGDNLCDDYPICAGGSISAEQQQYSLNSFSYGSGTGLSITPAGLNISLIKSITSPADSTDDIFWRMGIPSEQVTGAYSGQNIITVTADE